MFETGVVASSDPQQYVMNAYLLARASYGYLCWYQRSFLEHAYAVASVLGVERR